MPMAIFLEPQAPKKSDFVHRLPVLRRVAPRRAVYSGMSAATTSLDAKHVVQRGTSRKSGRYPLAGQPVSPTGRSTSAYSLSNSNRPRLKIPATLKRRACDASSRWGVRILVWGVRIDARLSPNLHLERRRQGRCRGRCRPIWSAGGRRKTRRGGPPSWPSTRRSRSARAPGSMPFQRDRRLAGLPARRQEAPLPSNRRRDAYDARGRTFKLRYLYPPGMSGEALHGFYERTRAPRLRRSEFAELAPGDPSSARAAISTAMYTDHEAEGRR